MVFDYVGTKLLPKNWEMWTNRKNKWQAVATFATEENAGSYTPILNTRQKALSLARKLVKQHKE